MVAAATTFLIGACEASEPDAADTEAETEVSDGGDPAPISEGAAAVPTEADTDGASTPESRAQAAVVRWETAVPGIEGAWEDAIARWTAQWELAVDDWELAWERAIAEWELAWDEAVVEWELAWEQAVVESELAWEQAAADWQDAVDEWSADRAVD